MTKKTKDKKDELSDENSLKRYKAYWKFRNELYNICDDAIDEKNIYMETVTSALDSVKNQLIQEQVKLQIENEEE